MWKRAFGLLSLLVLLAGGLSAHATADTMTHRTKGRGVSAAHSKVEGCIYSSFFVIARDGSSVYTGNAYPSPEDPAADHDRQVMVFVYDYDVCNYRTLRFAYGNAVIPNGPAFHTDGSLNQARLNVSLMLLDEVTWREIPVTVDLAWTGNGEASEYDNGYMYTDERGVFKISSEGRFRAANATGTLTVDTEVLFSGTTTSATISDAQNETITVIKP